MKVKFIFFLHPNFCLGCSSSWSAVCCFNCFTPQQPPGELCPCAAQSTYAHCHQGDARDAGRRECPPAVCSRGPVSSPGNHPGVTAMTPFPGGSLRIFLTSICKLILKDTEPDRLSRSKGCPAQSVIWQGLYWACPRREMKPQQKE